MSLLAIVLTTGSIAAQERLFNPRMVKDARHVCQITVPEDWGTSPDDPHDTSRMVSRERTMEATIGSFRIGQSFEDVKRRRTAEMKPVAILEDDIKRFSYLGRPGNMLTASKRQITVVLNATRVCSASVTFVAKSDEPRAKAIAASLRPAK